jgi:hypothetical protein
MSETAKKWQRSSYCGTAACVEVDLGREMVEVRDGKNPKLESLRLTRPQWDAFIRGVKDSQFDLS